MHCKGERVNAPILTCVDPRGLLRSLPDVVRPHVPMDIRDFRSNARWVIAQLYYGNRDLHYEAWYRARLRTIEVGLHFEADDLTNARLLGAFRAQERATRRALPAARLEEWDKGWARIWEPIEVEAVDEALRDRVAKTLARYVTTLEPMLRDALPSDVPWSMTARSPRKAARRTTSATRRR